MTLYMLKKGLPYFSAEDATDTLVAADFFCARTADFFCARTTDFFCAEAPREPLKRAMQQVANNNFFILSFRSKNVYK